MPTADTDNQRLGELVRQLTTDFKAITRDELALARAEARTVARTAARDAAVVALAGAVALIGLGMLCVAAVDGLAAVIAPLWLRLLLMAAVYLIVGGLLARLFIGRVRTDVSKGLERTRKETVKTAEAVKEAFNA